MKTLIALTIITLSAGAVITRPETKDFITVRRVAYDPNGTEIVLYERTTEQDISEYMPGEYKHAEAAVDALNDPGLLRLISIHAWQEADRLEGGE